VAVEVVHIVIKVQQQVDQVEAVVHLVVLGQQVTPQVHLQAKVMLEEMVQRVVTTILEEEAVVLEQWVKLE
jgi:hypothetical protein